MKNNALFGDFLRTLRLNKGITLNQLSQKINIPSSDISRWERGYVTPSVEDFTKVITFLNLGTEDVEKLAIFAGYDTNENLFTEKHQIKSTNLKNVQPDPVKQFDSRIQDIKDYVESIKLSLEDEANKQSGKNSKEVVDEIEFLKKQIVELQVSSKGLKAPVVLPTEEEMELKLIPSTIFQRVEEYRDEQSKWSSWFGIFVGSIIGIVINIITGGTLNKEVYPVGILLVLVSVLTGWTAYKKGKQAEGFIEQIAKPRKK